jgi:hypothetical protein
MEQMIALRQEALDAAHLMKVGYILVKINY